MPLPDFPLEIWLNILERACQDDGTTGVSLSSASQELRLFSKPYRYQSVQIKGWKQLLLFEVGYPNTSAWAPEDEPDSSSDEPSDDGSNDYEEWASEYDNLEFRSPSQSEQLELEEDANYFLHPEESPPQSRYNTLKGASKTLEDLQADLNFESCQAEGYGYAALHRVLKACASTLELLTLSWRPVNGFKADALFPVLPRLRSLTGDIYQIPEQPALFPALKRLEVNRSFDSAWFKLMRRDDLALECVAVSCRTPRFFLKHPQTVKRVRIFCDCYTGECSTRPLAAVPASFRVDSIDVKREWVDQVLEGSITPGFAEGRIPIILIAWVLKDAFGYSPSCQDAVLITDENRYICLWDHVHRLESHSGGQSQFDLEVYDCVQDVWYPVAWCDNFGLVGKVGSALLIRSVGISTMHNFDFFRPLSCSVSVTPPVSGTEH